MMHSDQLETAPVKQCHSCAAHLPASDNFCRSCGIDQRPRSVTAASKPNGSEFDTTVLTNAGEAAKANETLSSLLVKTITKSVAVKTLPLRSSRFGIRVVAGLAVIPIWLLIILLSPLEAYTAAKAASNQLNY